MVALSRERMLPLKIVWAHIINLILSQRSAYEAIARGPGYKNAKLSFKYLIIRGQTAKSNV